MPNAHGLSPSVSGLHAPVCLENCKNDKRIARRRKKINEIRFSSTFFAWVFYSVLVKWCAKKDDCMVYNNTRDLIICASIWLRSKRAQLHHDDEMLYVCVFEFVPYAHCDALENGQSRKKEHTCKQNENAQERELGGFEGKETRKRTTRKRENWTSNSINKSA